MNKKRLIKLCMILSLAVVCPCMGVCAQEDQYDIKEYGPLIEEFKDRLRDGSLQTEDEVREAIKEVEDKYDVDISAEDEKKAVDFMDKVNSLGVDGEKLAVVVDDVYDKAISDKVYESASDAIDAVEKQIVESAKEAVKESVKKTFKDYCADLLKKISEFFGEITSLWKK